MYHIYNANWRADRWVSPIPIARKVRLVFPCLIGCDVPSVEDVALGCGAVGRTGVGVPILLCGCVPRLQGVHGQVFNFPVDHLQSSVSVTAFLGCEEGARAEGALVACWSVTLCAELTEMNQNSLIESSHSGFKHLRMWVKRRKGDD